MQAFNNYLESQFQLHVKSLYATTVKVHTNLEDVVQATQKNERIENDISVSNKLRIILYIQNTNSAQYQFRSSGIHIFFS